MTKDQLLMFMRLRDTVALLTGSPADSTIDELEEALHATVQSGSAALRYRLRPYIGAASLDMGTTVRAVSRLAAFYAKHTGRNPREVGVTQPTAPTAGGSPAPSGSGGAPGAGAGG